MSALTLDFMLKLFVDRSGFNVYANVSWTVSTVGM